MILNKVSASFQIQTMLSLPILVVLLGIGTISFV